MVGSKGHVSPGQAGVTSVVGSKGHVSPGQAGVTSVPVGR